MYPLVGRDPCTVTVATWWDSIVGARLLPAGSRGLRRPVGGSAPQTALLYKPCLGPAV